MLTTPRLILRPWQDEDIPTLAAMFADPTVMRFFFGTRDLAYTERWVAGVRAHFERIDYGIWAIEVRGVTPFIGFCGLSVVPDHMPCAPAVEIAWTLAEAHWRRGYATEAARATLTDGFARCGLPEIVAFTAAVNTPSQSVMEKAGMRRDPAADFLHPRVPPGHRLAPHVLYRVTA